MENFLDITLYLARFSMISHSKALSLEKFFQVTGAYFHFPPYPILRP